jgi:signal transduction histidine kinase
VTVTAKGRATESGFELTVSDNGPGIPAELADRIFEPFVSGKSTGTGLGLALVHRIVENHGGTVSLETSSPQGAVFLFRFGR